MRWRAAASLLLIFLLPGAARAEPVAVRARPLAELLIRPEASAPATVVSLADSRISTELSGVIEAVPVRVGDRVEGGTILTRLDCTDYDLRAAELQARLDSVEARVAFARQQLERARKLRQDRTIPREQLDQRQSELLSLQAERAAGRAMLDRVDRDRGKCRVRAPFHALVTARLADVGEYVVPGTPLLRILDVDHLEISARIIVDDVATFEAADTLLFRHAGRNYSLTLHALLPVIDSVSRTREARLEFSADAALPGASGRLVWTLPPALPADLLVRRDGRLGVMLADGDTARFHTLPDAEEGRPATVDLLSDALIITEGRFGLSAGDAIELR